jgi:hypothetical protein
MTIRPPHHLLGHVERLGREHRAEDADDEVERLVRQPLQVGRVTLLEPAVRETFGVRASIAGLDEVAGDVDAQHLRAEARRRNRRRAVAAAEVQHLEPLRDADALDERRAALAHGVGDAREVALLPQGLVGIHGRPGRPRIL